ncbi:MAG: hypothetical protein MO853_10840 [Candidatus Protistobacter heckmanni]|nr:hypothetical protein [Candidatus Protistobacter heckmanni]
MRKPFRHALLTFLMLVGASAASARTSAQPAAPDTATLIRRAFVYAFPYQEMGALRLTWLGDGAAPGPTRLGNLTHARKLSTPSRPLGHRPQQRHAVLHRLA